VGPAVPGGLDAWRGGRGGTWVTGAITFLVESVVGLPGGPLILGGLDAGESSVSGVFQLDTGSGKLRSAGSLSGALHDAAAALLGGQCSSSAATCSSPRSTAPTSTRSPAPAASPPPTPTRV